MRRIIHRLGLSIGGPRRRRRLPKWARKGLLGLTILAGIAAYFVVIAQLSRNGQIDDHYAAARGWFTGQLARAGFSVNSIVAFGASQTEAQALRTAMAVPQGAPIVDLDLTAIRHKVEALPWVRVASVERSLPDRLIVRIVERQPAALLQENGQLSLIDSTGTPIRNTALTPFIHLPTVTGPGAAAATPDLLKVLQEAPILAARVTAATRFGERRWDVRVDDRVWVRLPEDDPATAWKHLARLDVEKSVLNHALEAVDVRDPRQWSFRLPTGMRMRLAIENSGS